MGSSFQDSKKPQLCQQTRVHASQRPFLTVVETEKFLLSVLAGLAQQLCAGTQTVQCSTTHITVPNLGALGKRNR